MINFDKYNGDIAFLYLFDSKGKYVSDFSISTRQLDLIPAGKGTHPISVLAGWKKQIKELDPTVTKYRYVSDPIAQQTLKCMYADRMKMEDDKAYDHIVIQDDLDYFYNSSIKELRAHPFVEISPYGGNYIGNQKFKTDLHAHITTKHLFKLGPHWGKTKLEIFLKDPITGEKVDGNYHATVKIEKLFDGFPELLQEKENITIKNGVCEYEFDCPTTECNIFFKVKPQAKAWKTDIPVAGEYNTESKGYNILKFVAAFTYRN
jgi:hypothetical protein